MQLPFIGVRPAYRVVRNPDTLGFGVSGNFRYRAFVYFPETNDNYNESIGGFGPKVTIVRSLVIYAIHKISWDKFYNPVEQPFAERVHHIQL